MFLLSLDHVVAIAHRGGSALRPENTFAAFDHAVTLGVDGLECDVRVTRDGQAVVIHDPTLERTTNGRGTVEDATADSLARLDAGSQFGADRGWPYRGQEIGIPTLREFLTRYRDLPIIVEIKGDRLEAADRAVSVIRDADADDRVIVAGFDGGVLRHVRRIAPHLVTSASRPEILEARVWSSLWLKPQRTPYRAFQAPLRFRGRQFLRKPLVRTVRRAGIPVHSWIVDHPEDMQMVLGWGVTGLISDRPDLAVQAARHANGNR